ncbi:hypothetical protein [Corynebacterium variabile]|uniref:Uncharacterized protein n=1 Tax=Corynebacterium variabile TaxID=1727 RepID=A0A4Y4C2W7_9CORY|nr:hypothetical protein [Corynebacterium variabile]GEC85413.1 hypothetical protein CVA01_07270 [Corynebacterium variabile]
MTETTITTALNIIAQQIQQIQQTIQTQQPTQPTQHKKQNKWDEMTQQKYYQICYHIQTEQQTFRQAAQKANVAESTARGFIKKNKLPYPQTQTNNKQLF